MVYGNQMNTVLLSGFSVFFLLFLFGCSEGKKVEVDCDPHAGPCTKQVGEYLITLDISPKPVLHMKELNFNVTVSEDFPPIGPGPLLLDLSMPGMDMGKNQVPLETTGDNRYSGTGIIVKCPSGRTIWRATVLLSENMKPAFTFNVRD